MRLFHSAGPHTGNCLSPTQYRSGGKTDRELEKIELNELERSKLDIKFIAEHERLYPDLLQAEKNI